MTNFPITLTPAASEKAWDLLSSQGREDLRLRLSVQAGGCSGLQLSLLFDERRFDGDLVENFGELEVVVDKMSAPYLEGAVVDFKDTIEKQGFDIENPNAAGSCACGDSFH
jgi:iron-sulfur cluster assembly accessory protein